ncbi:MAG: hypothetical protein ACFE9T_04795 [Promethearchaeota archaeon]
MADCIKKILEIHNNSEIAKYFILIKLMRDLKEDLSSTVRIRDCLLLLINLCFNNAGPDNFNNKGKLIHQLTKEEKNYMCQLLKSEFNS